MRKTAWVLTGGASGFVFKANSKKERMARSLETLAAQGNLGPEVVVARSGDPKRKPAYSPPPRGPKQVATPYERTLKGKREARHRGTSTGGGTVGGGRLIHCKVHGLITNKTDRYSCDLCRGR
jgi:hypothetical protein